MKKQIICINWGTKHGPKYITRLYGEADPEPIYKFVRHYLKPAYWIQKEWAE